MESLLDRSDADVRGVRAPVRDDRRAPGRPSDNSAFLRSSYSGGDDYGGYGSSGDGQSYPHAEYQYYDQRGAGGGSTDPYSYSPQAERGDTYDAQPYYPSGAGAGGPPRGDHYAAQEYYGGGDSQRQSQPSAGYGRAPAPTIAGQANKRGGIYDRLSSPTTFTGVKLVVAVAVGVSNYVCFLSGVRGEI